MSKNKSIDAWLKGGKYLPPFMRDFHDQKELFKTIHETYSLDLSQDPLAKISWVAAHCYVIDIFLWWMAKHGYTLQKTQADYEFKNPGDTLSKAYTNRREQFAKQLFGSAQNEQKDQKEQS